MIAQIGALLKAINPKLPVATIVLALALLVAAAALFYKWYKSRKPGGGKASAKPVAGGTDVIGRNRLVALRRKFFGGLPFRYRATVKGFPTVAVLGPAASGKSTLIDGEVDWRRQANQFLPSLTSDPLLQIYLGPDVMVQELSAPVMEDDSQHARRALKNLWKSTFSDHEPLVVLVLDAGWLVQTAPDEVRRITQLLRGKLNLISEIVRTPIETRISLTHCDLIPGFTDFARLLHDNGVPLEFDLPPRGEEDRIADALKPYESYLALALTSLSVDAFERLEDFYSHGGEMLAALSRFVRALWEGGALANPPKLTRLHFFSPLPEARSVDIFELPPEIARQDLSPRYRRDHLRRCALIAVGATIPFLAAYANMLYQVRTAEGDLRQLSGKVHKAVTEQRAAECASLAEVDVHQAMKSMQELSRAMRWWPPLRSSFSRDRRDMNAELAKDIRDCFLQPYLDRCQQVDRGEGDAAPGSKDPSCTREQSLYALGVLYAAREDDLGRFILKAHGRGADPRGFHDVSDVLDAIQQPDQVEFDNLGDFAAALDTAPEVLASYVAASDGTYDAPWHWRYMPFSNQDVDAQLCPWQQHFTMLNQLLGLSGKDVRAIECASDVPTAPAASAPPAADRDESDDDDDWSDDASDAPANARGAADAHADLHKEWQDLVEHGKPLRRQLEVSRSFRNAAALEKLLAQSTTNRVKLDEIRGLDARLDVIAWMQANRDSLEAYFRMEDQAERGYQLAEKMLPSELLTRSDGLFIPGDKNARWSFDVSGRPFAFEPDKISKQLMEELVNRWEAAGRLSFLRRRDAIRTHVGGAPDACEGVLDLDGKTLLKPVMDRAQFDSDVKPSIADFTLRMAQTKLSPEEKANRVNHVMREAERFSRQYRSGLLCSYHRYAFAPALQDKVDRFEDEFQPDGSRERAREAKSLSTQFAKEVVALAKPANPLGDMLRDVSLRANLGQLDGEYFDPVRNAVAPFKSIVHLMTPDKDGLYPELNKYIAIVGQFANDAALAPKATDDGGAVTVAALASDDVKPKADDKPKSDEKADGKPGDKEKDAAAGQRLVDKLSPLGRVALPILLNQDGSYLKKVDAWLDQENILGEFRNPFREPFLVAAAIGRFEIEQVIAEEWRREYAQTVQPLLDRYPFNPKSDREIDLTDLDVLRKKDGRFWQFVDRIVAPVVTADGLRYTPRKLVDDELSLPPDLIPALNRFARVADLLWDDAGNRKPLALQVRPMPLTDEDKARVIGRKTPLDDAPPAPAASEKLVYATISYLKVGQTVSYGYNQQPMWQDFPFQWWNQDTASVGVQLTSPDSDGTEYRAIDLAQGWSFYRLLAMATRSVNNEFSWTIRLGELSAELGGLQKQRNVIRVRFALRGDPWAPFRSVR